MLRERPRIFLPFLLVLLSTATGRPQTKEAKNPFEGDPKAIEQGKHIYRFACAPCHGFDGRGYRAPDLTTGQWTHGGSDAQLYQVITRGIPGTEMIGSDYWREDEVWMLIAYLRTLSGPGTDEEARGNAENGEKIYWGKGNCAGCHMINGKGGRLGPDLSRIGAARSRSALVREIRKASEYLLQGYEPVTVVTREGRRIRGLRKNEEPFSIQVMDTNEQLLAFFKKDLREIIDEDRSLMPDYGPDRLTDGELDDLLRYLRTLRGPAAPPRN